MTTLRTVQELQQHRGQSTRDQGTHLAQVPISLKFNNNKKSDACSLFRSFDIPRSPTHVMEDRKRNKAKADRDQPPEEHNTGAAKKHRKLTYHEAYVCSFSDGD